MILPEIPLLTPGMSVKQGLATMQMSGLSSLPIVDEGSYVGVVHEKELLRDDVAGKIGRENWRTPSVREESHLFDVVNQLAQYSDDILPVVTTDRRYVGAISIHSALVAPLSATRYMLAKIRHPSRNGKRLNRFRPPLRLK